MKWRVVPARPWAAQAPHWDALHRACAGSPVLHAEFVGALLAQFGGGAELLAICSAGADTIAMALMAPAGRGRWATFQPAQAPLGAWLQLPGHDSAALLAALVHALPGALLASVTQCDPELLPRPSGTRVRTIDYIQTARVSVRGSFAAYWEGRGKNLRANLKKQRARLQREGIATRLETLTAPRQMAAAVADYARLESSGWKAGAGTAVQAGDAQGRFYTGMLEAYARRGAATVYRYWVGGQLAAMDLCVHDERVLVVLKTSYDEQVGAGLSATLLMREEATRQLFDEARIQRIEFYGRVMEWHLRWTDEVRTLYHINCYRWPALRTLHQWLQRRGAPSPHPPTETACTSTK